MPQCLHCLKVSSDWLLMRFFHAVLDHLCEPTEGIGIPSIWKSFLRSNYSLRSLHVLPVDMFHPVVIFYSLTKLALQYLQNPFKTSLWLGWSCYCTLSCHESTELTDHYLLTISWSSGPILKCNRQQRAFFRHSQRQRNTGPYDCVVVASRGTAIASWKFSAVREYAAKRNDRCKLWCSICCAYGSCSVWGSVCC